MSRGGYRPGAGGQRKEIKGKLWPLYLYPKQIAFLSSIHGEASKLIRDLLDQEIKKRQEQTRREELERIRLNDWRPL